MAVPIPHGVGVEGADHFEALGAEAAVAEDGLPQTPDAD